MCRLLQAKTTMLSVHLPSMVGRYNTSGVFQSYKLQFRYDQLQQNKSNRPISVISTQLNGIKQNNVHLKINHFVRHMFKIHQKPKRKPKKIEYKKSYT